MSSYCIGIDLGGTNIKFGLMGKDHQAGQIFQLPTPVEEGRDAIIERIIEGARRLVGMGGTPKQKMLGGGTKVRGGGTNNKVDRAKICTCRKSRGNNILAIGIGAPGLIDAVKGTVLVMPNLPGMVNVPLRDILSGEFGVPAVVENDANAAAYGEFLCGAGSGKKNMVLLTLGTGLGSGIIVDGRLVHGSHNIGSELGHMIVQPGGQPCACGQRGCLERYCSAAYIAKAAMDLIRQGRASSLKSIMDSRGAIDAADINAARKAGDGLAAEVWDRMAYYLAVGCVNICRAVDPDVIVLSGGLSNAGEDLLDPLRRHFASLHWSLSAPATSIVPARLGNNAGVIGAAALAWRTSRQ